MLNDAVKDAEWRCKTMPNRAVKGAGAVKDAECVVKRCLIAL